MIQEFINKIIPNTKKTLLVVFILVVVAILYLGLKDSRYINYYVFHKGMPPGYCDLGPCNNPKKTTDTESIQQNSWKTYISTEWGFSISYPDKYQLKDNHFRKALPYYKDLVDIVSIPNKQSSPALSISVVNDFGELHPRHITDIQDYVTSAYPASQNNKITAVTINGNSGYQVDLTNDPNVKPRHIVFQDKAKVIYDLFLPADNSDFNAIVQTFQFIK